VTAVHIAVWLPLRLGKDITGLWLIYLAAYQSCLACLALTAASVLLLTYKAK
jgi:hypothetical protein